MIRLKDGQSYIDREGFVVSVTKRQHGAITTYPFVGSNNRFYMENGRYISNDTRDDHPCDLISEDYET